MELAKMPDKLFVKKLLGNLNSQEASELQYFLDKNPDALHEFHAASIIWEESANVGAFLQIDTKADWKTVRAKIDPAFSSKYKKIPLASYFIRIAALVLLTSGLSFGFYKFMLFHKTPVTGFTTYDSQIPGKNILLPDGSAVSLKKGSSISFRDGFGTVSRDVILQGEAFFSVIPGLSLPFKVYTGQSVVEVTGTQFSVAEKAGIIQVSVISGSVILSTKQGLQKKLNLKANESGYLIGENELIVEKGIPANTLSWKTGHLVFDKTLIDSALIDIADHFNKSLVLNVDLNERITAEFQDQPLNEILDELRIVAGLKFDTTSTALIVRK